MQCRGDGRGQEKPGRVRGLGQQQATSGAAAAARARAPPSAPSCPPVRTRFVYFFTSSDQSRSDSINHLLASQRQARGLRPRAAALPRLPRAKPGKRRAANPWALHMLPPASDAGLRQGSAAARARLVVAAATNRGGPVSLAVHASWLNCYPGGNRGPRRRARAIATPRYWSRLRSQLPGLGATGLPCAARPEASLVEAHLGAALCAAQSASRSPPSRGLVACGRLVAQAVPTRPIRRTR